MIFATGGKYQNMEKPLKHQRRLGLIFFKLQAILLYNQILCLPNENKTVVLREQILSEHNLKILVPKCYIMTTIAVYKYIFKMYIKSY